MIFFIKKHTLYLIYSFIFIVLIYGTFLTSGSQYLPQLGLFFFALSASYLFLNKSINPTIRLNLDFITSLKHIEKDKYLFILCVSLITAHLIQLGNIPSIEASYLNNGDAIAMIRSNLSLRNGTLFNYISSFLIHSFLPFTILILYAKNRKTLYFILLLLASFYGFALMQKSYILTIFIPIIAYSLMNKKIINFFLTSSIVVLVIISLTYIANPQLKPKEKAKIEKAIAKNKDLKNKRTKQTPSALTRIAIGLKNRVIITPGEMITTWFDNIPKNLPHQGINGYGFVSKIRNVTHVDYGKEMYLVVEKDKAELKGTMNAASFMYEYAYFGNWGLVLSGICLALIFFFIESLFIDNFELKLALNLYSILILSSSSMTTLIISGGWGLIIFLSLITNFETKKTNG